MTLLLSKAGESADAGEGTIDYFRDLIGPKDVNIAKEEAPNRWSELLTMLCKSQSASKLVKRIIIVFVHGDLTDSSTFICLAALEAYIKYE